MAPGRTSVRPGANLEPPRGVYPPHMPAGVPTFWPQSQEPLSPQLVQSMPSEGEL
jgi:hypothetical protein